MESHRDHSRPSGLARPCRHRYLTARRLSNILVKTMAYRLRKFRIELPPNGRRLSKRRKIFQPIVQCLGLLTGLPDGLPTVARREEEVLAKAEHVPHMAVLLVPEELFRRLNRVGNSGLAPAVVLSRHASPEVTPEAGHARPNRRLS